MAGFYALSILVASALFLVPLLGLWLHGYPDPGLMLLCMPVAAMILWSIVPRPDRFKPPGPALRAEDHPRLFGVLESLAQSMGQPMPSEIYLLPRTDAWVTYRGGVMGLGSRRVMGLGLPLLMVLSVRELSAVLAHELGHFSAGDFRLGPWIYKTRSSMARTLEALHRGTALLQVVFTVYALLFLRVTRAVSREQELAADRLAARTVSPEELIRGLLLLRCAGAACDAYWSKWVVPMVERGYHAPLVEGCRRFLSAHVVREALTECLEHDETRQTAGPFDTHPPIDDRIRALEAMAPPPGPLPEDSPALSLLEDPGIFESHLLGTRLDPEQAGTLTRVSWAEVGTRVWLPEKEALARRHAAALRQITAGTLPEAARDLEGLSHRLGDPPAEEDTPENRREWSAETLAAALAVALHRAGWELRFQVGDEVSFVKGEVRVEPAQVVHRLASGDLSAEAWADLCRRTAIEDLNLGNDGTWCRGPGVA